VATTVTASGGSGDANEKTPVRASKEEQWLQPLRQAGDPVTPMKKQMIMNIGVMAREEEQWL